MTPFNNCLFILLLLSSFASFGSADACKRHSDCGYGNFCMCSGGCLDPQHDSGRAPPNACYPASHCEAGGHCKNLYYQCSQQDFCIPVHDPADEGDIFRG